MQVLSVASECYPLAKTGGLADVVAALPDALARQGVVVTTLLPAYRGVREYVERGGRSCETVLEYADCFGGAARLLRTRFSFGQDVRFPHHDLLLLDAPHLYDRPGSPYQNEWGGEWEDIWKRFAALSYVAADIAQGSVRGFEPDILHAHDWQAALAPVYLRYAANEKRKPPCVVTIHNLAFQGRFDGGIFPFIYLPPHAYSPEGVESYGVVNYLLGGIRIADAITTVSPTYAREIQGGFAGMGLEGILSARHADLHGILNGIDTAVWNPETDIHLTARFSAESIERRALNKAEIFKRFHLQGGPQDFLASIVSRLGWQKGIDLLMPFLHDQLANGLRLALLGSGDEGLLHALRDLQWRFPGRLSIETRYDEQAAHLLQGGSDVFLIPSRFEPCGLTQQYAMRYGCLPIAARVGGLVDTVTNDVTGFLCWPDNSEELRRTLDGARKVFYEAPERWRAMQVNAMKRDSSWDASAKRFHSIFTSLLQRRAGR